MPRRRSGDLFNIGLVFAAAAALSACSHAQTADPQPDAQPAATAPAPVAATAANLPAHSPPAAPEAPAAPMTREKASTECWMRYEKQGRGLSLDQRLPLVEKCTAEKLKAAGR